MIKGVVPQDLFFERAADNPERWTHSGLSEDVPNPYRNIKQYPVYFWVDSIFKIRGTVSP